MCKVNPHMPVHYITKDKYEIFPIENFSNNKYEKIIFALDKDGIAVITIYIID